MNKRWDNAAKRWAAAVLMAGMAWAGAASATFINQGDGTVLDTTTNLEWEQNANHGPFSWAGAKNYADTLSLDGGGWHLATITELQDLFNDLQTAGVCSGTNCTGSIAGFSDIQFVYWSGTEVGSSARNFNFGNGRQSVDAKPSPIFSAWAVRSGDVIATVPEPQTVAMLLFGLGLLGWRTKRR